MVDQGVDIARFAAATVACLTGEDPEVAALAAGNAARYNALSWHEVKDTLFPGRDLESLKEDIVKYLALHKESIEAAGQWGRYWAEDFSQMFSEHQMLQSIMGRTGENAGILFGVGMTVPNILRGKGGKPILPEKHIHKLEALDLAHVSKATEHVWVSRLNQVKNQKTHPLEKKVDNLRGLDLAENKALQNNLFGKFSQVTKQDIFLKFKKDSAEQHFSKHAGRIQKVFGRSSYNLKDYMMDANHIVNNGMFVPELNGFVKLIGGTGKAKVGFVGIERSENIITTFHIESVKDLVKKAPSLGWLK
jgi:hypothetical protein